MNTSTEAMAWALAHSHKLGGTLAPDEIYSVATSLPGVVTAAVLTILMVKGIDARIAALRTSSTTGAQNHMGYSME